MTTDLRCSCLSLLDRRDGRRCDHDSWGTRRPSPEQHWATPHRLLSLPLFLFVAASVLVLFVAVLSLGQAVMCAWHDQSLSYCPGFTAPTDSEEPLR